MSRFHRPTGDELKNVLKWSAVGVAGTQLAAAATVFGVDEWRKRRHPQTHRFPYIARKDSKVEHNDVRIYTYGEDLFVDQLEAIRNAKEYIFFETYIMKADSVGYEFRSELVAAAERGVQVFVILDTFGNLNQDPRFRRFPKHENLHMIRFPLLRTGLLTGNPKDRGLDHRKVMTVDRNIGFIGGYNVGKLYAHHWRDTHIRIVGPQVRELDNSFVSMWNVYRKKDQPELPDIGNENWNPKFQSIQNIPALKSYPVRALYLEAIDRATDHLWITMGYFIPDEGVKHSLINAAKRGVDVRVLVPEYSNHIIADWVGRPHYSDLLRGGVRIFRFEQAMVHAKTMTVDGVWSTVGTTNIDRLSMAGNYEINVELFSEDFADQMREIFEIDLSNSHEVDREKWENRGLRTRALERVLKPLAPFF